MYWKGSRCVNGLGAMANEDGRQHIHQCVVPHWLQCLTQTTGKAAHSLYKTLQLVRVGRGAERERERRRRGGMEEEEYEGHVWCALCFFMTCSLLASFGIYEFLEPEMRAEIAIFSHLT